MHFSAGARFARCRSGHLSYFARQTAAQSFQVHRGLASVALSKLCVEAMPPTGFPEQRISALFSSGLPASSEGDGAQVGEADDVLAAIIDGAIAETISVSYSATSFHVMAENQGRRPSRLSP
eukprot:TRINITY_DN120_c0_g1_i1.p2 TRINITY_DN120_c0_g1~~TRINITY_DN120_c0_g1_i1.p2  ORF type:complete len:122 (+),score=13.14 TRINITY_DN120_c0_g1_i1:89-454(+)